MGDLEPALFFEPGVDRFMVDAEIEIDQPVGGPERQPAPPIRIPLPAFWKRARPVQGLTDEEREVGDEEADFRN